MGNEKMKTFAVINMIGALFAYLVGSGFATGQEIMQFYSVWGSIGRTFIVAIITSAMLYFGYLSYAYLGRTRGIEDIAGIYNVYAGNTLGKVFEAFAWAYNAACYIFMVSGFGSLLRQQWGINIKIGVAIGVILSVGTAVMGLTKMVEIIGKIGPIIVVFTLALGIVSAFRYYPHIAEGNALINSEAIKVTKAGSNVWLSGISYGGTCLLLVSAFVGRMGNDLSKYKFKYNKIILAAGAIGIPLCSVVMALNYVGNIEASHVSDIPSLLLANNFGLAVSTIFSLVIIAAVYSSICPILWTCVSMFIKDETSLKYKVACIAGGAVVYVIAISVPYQVLLNKLMTYGGYCGGIVCAVCVVRYYMIKSSSKEEVIM